MDPSSSSSPPLSPPKTTSPILSASDAEQFPHWRETLSRITGLPLFGSASSSSDPEAVRLAQEEQEWNKCEALKIRTMKEDPAVDFMLKHLRLSGCPTTAASIHCAPCDATKSGGFSPEHGVLLCQNWLKNSTQMSETLTHELIHMYDYCKFDVDFSNLRHHACTEIRAANLSGDCTWWNEAMRGRWKMKDAQSQCVRRRAVLSVMGNPECKSKEEAEHAVDDVWMSCKADTRPFDEIYKL